MAVYLSAGGVPYSTPEQAGSASAREALASKYPASFIFNTSGENIGWTGPNPVPTLEVVNQQGVTEEIPMKDWTPQMQETFRQTGGTQAYAQTTTGNVRQPKLFIAELASPKQPSQAEIETDRFLKTANPIERGIVRLGTIATNYGYWDAIGGWLVGDKNIPTPAQAERTALIEARQARITAEESSGFLTSPVMKNRPLGEKSISEVLGESPWTSVAATSLVKGVEGPATRIAAVAGTDYLFGGLGAASMLSKPDVGLALLGVGGYYSTKEGYEIGTLVKEGKKGEAAGRALLFGLTILAGEAGFRAGRSNMKVPKIKTVTMSKSDAYGPEFLKVGEGVPFTQKGMSVTKMGGKTMYTPSESVGKIGIANYDREAGIAIVKAGGRVTIPEIRIPTKFAGKNAFLVKTSISDIAPAILNVKIGEQGGMGTYRQAFKDMAVGADMEGIGEYTNLFKQTGINKNVRVGRRTAAGGTLEEGPFGKITGEFVSFGKSVGASMNTPVISAERTTYNIMGVADAPGEMFTGGTALKTRQGVGITDLKSPIQKMNVNFKADVGASIKSAITGSMKPPTIRTVPVSSIATSSMKPSTGFLKVDNTLVSGNMGINIGKGDQKNNWGENIQKQFSTGLQGFKSNQKQTLVTNQRGQEGKLFLDNLQDQINIPGMDRTQTSILGKINLTTTRQTTSYKTSSMLKPPPTINILEPPGTPRTTSLFFPSMITGGGGRGGRRGFSFGKRSLRYTPTVAGVMSGFTIKRAPRGDVGPQAAGIRLPVRQEGMRIRIPLFGNVNISRKSKIKFTGINMKKVAGKKRKLLKF